MRIDLIEDPKATIRVPYALRRVPDASLCSLRPCSDAPRPGDIALAKLEKVGKNAKLELRNGRTCLLHEGDLLAVVFGNRYATHQFEGYARANGDQCDLLSMGGLCGLVESKHADVPEPSRLRLLGFVGDCDRRPLRLQQFALPATPMKAPPNVRVIVVCGTSMDAGKTHTAASVIAGLKKSGHRVAGVKLTGTAAGKDLWKMVDSGASLALDFVDAGLPSTYLCDLDELLNMHKLFLAHAATQNASCVVVEIADGLLQNETAALLQSPRFCETVDRWVLAAGDPLAAAGAARVLRSWGIKPVALSGVVAMSPLGIKEAQTATGLPCLSARDLQMGKLNPQLLEQSTTPTQLTVSSSREDDLYQVAE